MGWDTDKLVQEQLLCGARKLIVIHLREGNGDPRVISLTIDRVLPKGGYRRVDAVLQNRRLYDIMLADALREFSHFEAKYHRLQELKPAFKEVERVRRKVAARDRRKGGAERRATA